MDGAPLAALMAQLVMASQQPGGLQMGAQMPNAAQMMPPPGIQQPPGLSQANPGLTGSGGPAPGGMPPRFAPPTRMPPKRPSGM